MSYEQLWNTDIFYVFDVSCVLKTCLQNNLVLHSLLLLTGLSLRNQGMLSRFLISSFCTNFLLTFLLGRIACM